MCNFFLRTDRHRSHKHQTCIYFYDPRITTQRLTQYWLYTLRARLHLLEIPSDALVSVSQCHSYTVTLAQNLSSTIRRAWSSKVYISCCNPTAGSQWFLPLCQASRHTSAARGREGAQRGPTMAPNGVNGIHPEDDEDIDYTDIENKCVNTLHHMKKYLS